MADLRVVIDTNVVVSALLSPASIPRQAFDLAAAQGRILLSSATVAELDEVLRRPKFAKYISEEQRLVFLAALVRDVELVDVAVVVTECRDSKDNKFLELAISGRATHIVSGDDDLLTLTPFRQIPILNPQDFIDRVRTP